MRTTDSVDRVVSVLELLAETPDGLGVSEVADALGVHKTTGSRLLGTLAARGLLERDPVTRRYWLGTGIVGLAGAAIARLRVVSQARPELERLSALTSETVNLAILNGRHVVYVDQVTPRQAVVMANWVGRRSPAHASSSGKVLLAFGDELVRRAVLSRRERSPTRLAWAPSSPAPVGRDTSGAAASWRKASSRSPPRCSSTVERWRPSASRDRASGSPPAISRTSPTWRSTPRRPWGAGSGARSRHDPQAGNRCPHGNDCVASTEPTP